MPCQVGVNHGKHGGAVSDFACPVCSTIFRRYLCEVVAATPTCSKACRVRFKPTKIRKRVTLTCEVCASPFDVIESRGARARFCSAACRNAKQKGRSHPAWRGGLGVRTWEAKTVMRRAVAEVGKCQDCGATGNLHAHHTKSYADYPELRADRSNIEVLCGVCHGTRHPHLANGLAMPRIRSGAVLDCAECGSPFYVKPSAVGRRLYCSAPCGSAAISARRRAARSAA
jgi:5-methylcytosine-specific restriction endonuclease McrA